MNNNTLDNSNIELFKEKVEQLNKEMHEYYTSINEPVFLPDGIVNLDTYYNSKFKILWILKEPYDQENENKCSWSLSGMLNMSHDELVDRKIHKSKTWKPIIETTYCILNNIEQYELIDGIKDSIEMLDVLKNIAIINVKKTPGATVTPYAKLKKAYTRDNKIILNQIDLYNPDIIIGGNTMYLFHSDLFSNAPAEYDEIAYWLKGSSIYIDAPHPGKRIQRGDYANDILLAIRKWKGTR